MAGRGGCPVQSLFANRRCRLVKVLRHSASPKQWQRLIAASSMCLVGKTVDQHQPCFGVGPGRGTAVEDKLCRGSAFDLLPVRIAEEVIPRFAPTHIGLFCTWR